MTTIREKINRTRFWSNTTTQGDCIVWTGYTDKDGYGKYNTIAAHRFAYEERVGVIPSGLQIDHLCRVRSCVNPKHLEPVTAYENQRRSPYSNISRKDCRRGHEFTKENTYITPKNKRQCRKCNLEANRKYRRTKQP